MPRDTNKVASAKLQRDVKSVTHYDSYACGPVRLFYIEKAPRNTGNDLLIQDDMRAIG
jgi:hypothetical protein